VSIATVYSDLLGVIKVQQNIRGIGNKIARSLKPPPFQVRHRNDTIIAKPSRGSAQPQLVTDTPFPKVKSEFILLISSISF
jgi:hypothetical protein